MGQFDRDDADTPRSRLPRGMSPAGYDADRQVYKYLDEKGGIWESAPGNVYGKLIQVSGPGFSPTTNKREEAMWSGGLQKQLREEKEQKKLDKEREKLRIERRKERARRREERKQNTDSQRNSVENQGSKDGDATTSPKRQSKEVNDQEYQGGSASVGINASPEVKQRSRNSDSDKRKILLQKRIELDFPSDSERTSSSSRRQSGEIRTSRHSSTSRHSRQSNKSYDDRDEMTERPPPAYLSPSHRFTSFNQLSTTSPRHSRSSNSSTKKTNGRSRTEDSFNQDHQEEERRRGRRQQSESESDSVLAMAGRLTRAVSLRVGNLKGRDRKRRESVV